MVAASAGTGSSASGEATTSVAPRDIRTMATKVPSCWSSTPMPIRMRPRTRLRATKVAPTNRWLPRVRTIPAEIPMTVAKSGEATLLTTSSATVTSVESTGAQTRTWAMTMHTIATPRTRSTAGSRRRSHG
uniref:Uncharacterized protein n=1 Tax=Janibacter limosus TaxID=53458 RepID=A0AC61U718_9MICO|nr:hypothetical protein [Janibacter limosus]